VLDYELGLVLELVHLLPLLLQDVHLLHQTAILSLERTNQQLERFRSGT
jgi:hypothetical protein